MKVFRITKCNYINDLTGIGASLNGGRWNSEGKYALYTASTASLAMLETLAHLKVMPDNGFCIASLDIPDDLSIMFNEQLLPSDWHSIPAPTILQSIGDAFLRENKFLAIQFPSALLREDKVILLNPKHPKFSLVKVDYTRPLDIDKRLYKK